jgi:hypothetical protein
MEMALCPLLAQSGHYDRPEPCPLSGVKRTLGGDADDHALALIQQPVAGMCIKHEFETKCSRGALNCRNAHEAILMLHIAHREAATLENAKCL